MVSVIIPTYNGAHKLPGILHSLEQQTHAPDEVLVVVDGATDNTLGVLQATTWNLPLRIVTQENRGRAAVRNRGAAEAVHDLLLFFDDDMLLPATCVQKHVEHHQAYEGSILTGGLQEPDQARRSDFSRFKDYLNRRWSLTFHQTGLTRIANENPYLTAGNLSLSKAVFATLNGFDEGLNDAEDYDLAVRAVKEQIPLFYNADAFAWHNENVNCLTYIKRLRQYAKAQEKLAALKPSLYSRSIRKAQVPGGLKAVVFDFFCSRWWIESVDQGTWTWLPQQVRFKLYDLIVTANGSFFPNKVLL